jgi:CheY-like chemotaxis protein
VIIVDDKALVTKFLRMALQSVGGYSCTVTEDAPEMLKEIEAGEVDLVLLHVSLSNAQWEGHLVNGVELSQILKEVAPTTAGSAGDRSHHERGTASASWKPAALTAILRSRYRTQPYWSRKSAN